VFLDSLAACATPPLIVSLTADHGVTSVRSGGTGTGILSQWINLRGMVRADSAKLAALAGPYRWIRYFDSGLLVMDARGWPPTA